MSNKLVKKAIELLKKVHNSHGKETAHKLMRSFDIDSALELGDLDKNELKSFVTKANNYLETKPAKKKTATGNKGKAEPTTRVITQPCRSSFMFLIEPRENDKGVEEYSTQVLISKKDKVTLERINAAIELAAKKKFGPKVKLGQLKLPLRDPKSEEREGDEYKGFLFLNAKNSHKPGVVDRGNRKIIGDEQYESLYSGGWYRFSLTFYGFADSGNKGIAVIINNVMFHKHDARLDGSIAVEDEFEDYGEYEDEDE